MPYKRKRPLVLVLTFTLLFISSSTLYQWVASTAERQQFLPPGQLVTVDGFRLHLNCTGQSVNGSPTIVLEGGLGAPALMWTLVQPGLAAYTRVCSYDRAGYGWSDPGPSPRTARQLTTELHTLLQNAGEAAPYLLVGHSLGGIIARLYAADYASEVVGLVLVDSRHEDFFERMPPTFLQVDESNLRWARTLTLLTPLGITRIAGATGRLDSFTAYLAPLPDDVEQTAWALMIYNPQHWATSVEEREAIDESYQQVKTTHLRDDLPLIVLTAENGVDAWRSTTNPVDAASRTAWMELQKELTNFTKNSQWIIVKNSGHYMYFDQPQAIVEAVASMLGR